MTQLELTKSLDVLVSNMSVNRLITLLKSKYAGCEYSHIFLAAEDETEEDESSDTDEETNASSEEPSTEDETTNESSDTSDDTNLDTTSTEEEAPVIERTDPKELARTLRTLNHRLKEYRNSVANMSNDIDERVNEDIEYIKDITKDINLSEYAVKTSLPAPDEFIHIVDATDEVLDALLKHNTESFLEDAQDPKKIDLFDNVFTNRIKDLFADIGIIKTEAGMPAFEGFEKIKMIKTDGDISHWLNHLEKLTDLIERFSLKKSIDYTDKLMKVISTLIDNEKANEFIYPSLNLLVTTVQQMILVELSAKSYLMRVISKVKSSMKTYSKSLDNSDVLLTS
jgi:hypothetical protein